MKRLAWVLSLPLAASLSAQEPGSRRPLVGVGAFVGGIGTSVAGVQVEYRRAGHLVPWVSALRAGSTSCLDRGGCGDRWEAWGLTSGWRFGTDPDRSLEAFLSGAVGFLRWPEPRPRSEGTWQATIGLLWKPWRWIQPRFEWGFYRYRDWNDGGFSLGLSAAF